MIKNKVLTPVLSGVLAVSVVGSGVGYYFVNKGEPEKTMDTMKVSMTQVEQTVNTTVDDVQKAVNGKLDFAYDADLKITVGNSEAMKNSGVQVQPIEVSTKVRQKGQNSSAEIAAKYNGSTLATLETVYARDSKTGYVRIPELSSAYIKATEADIQKLVDDAQKKYTSKYQLKQDTNKRQTKTNQNRIADIKPKEKFDVNKIKEMLPDLSDLDSKKVEEKLNKWVEIVKGKITEKADNGTVSGDIEGNSYNYKVKTYSISGKQAQEAILAVLDDIAADKDIKKVFDDFYAKQPEANKKASGIKSFAELIAKMKSELKIDASQQNKVASLDVYYDGNEPAGAAFSFDGKTYAKAVIINKSDVNAIDAFITDNNGNANFTVKGSSKLADGKVSGKYTLDCKGKNSNNTNVSLTLDKVVVKDKTFSGTVTLDFTASSATGSNKSGSFKISGTADEDKKDLKINISANGINVLTVDFKMNKTKATDVSIPTTNVFTVDQLDAYRATCDIEGFKQNLSSALGINLSGLGTGLGNGAITKKSTTFGNNGTNNVNGGLSLDDLMTA